MKLNVKKRLAAHVLKCSPKRIRLDTSKLEEIKESITKADIRALVIDKAIVKKPARGVSRVRARKIHIQKVKGKRKGHGSRKGKATARLSRKASWMNAIRKQKVLLKELRDTGKILKSTYHNLYRKAKGGFFRSVRHIRIYLEEHNLVKNGKS